MEHVGRTCLAECCGSRDDSLSWNLSPVKQCGAIQVDSMDPQGRQGQDTPRSRKEKIKLKDVFLRRMNVQTTRMHRDPTQQSEVNDLSHDVFVDSSQVLQPRELSLWATGSGISVELMNWLDVMKDDVKRPKHRSRLCRKRGNRWDCTVPRVCVYVLRRLFLEARMRARMTANCWEKKWQSVLIEMNFEVGIWSPEIMCCCGQVHRTHEDDFVPELMPIARTESQLDEKKDLKGKAVLDKDDNDDDKMEMSHQDKEIEIRKALRFVVRDAVLWQPSLPSHRAETWNAFLERHFLKSPNALLRKLSMFDLLTRGFRLGLKSKWINNIEQL